MQIAVIVAIIVGGLMALLAAGVWAFFYITANRFDCESTRRRGCSDATLKRALLPEAYLYRLHDLICKANDAFIEAEMPYVAICGTLLSAMRRNGSLIPWDDDADVAVFASAWDDFSRKERFKEALTTRGLKLLPPSASGLITERVVFEERDESLDEQPFMDVFVYARNKESNVKGELHYKDMMSRLKFPRETTTTDTIFPIRKTKLVYKEKECEVSIPAKAEAMLNKVYGDRWRSQFIVATHRDSTMAAPCMLSDEQAVSLGLL